MSKWDWLAGRKHRRAGCSFDVCLSPSAFPAARCWLCARTSRLSEAARRGRTGEVGLGGARVLRGAHIVRHLRVVAKEVDGALRGAHAPLTSRRPRACAPGRARRLAARDPGPCCRPRPRLAARGPGPPFSAAATAPPVARRACRASQPASGGAVARRGRPGGRGAAGAHVVVRVPGHAGVGALRGRVLHERGARHREALLEDDACARPGARSGRPAGGHRSHTRRICLG